MFGALHCGVVGLGLAYTTFFICSSVVVVFWDIHMHVHMHMHMHIHIYPYAFTYTYTYTQSYAIHTHTHTHTHRIHVCTTSSAIIKQACSAYSTFCFIPYGVFMVTSQCAAAVFHYHVHGSRPDLVAEHSNSTSSFIST